MWVLPAILRNPSIRFRSSKWFRHELSFALPGKEGWKVTNGANWSELDFMPDNTYLYSYSYSRSVVMDMVGIDNVKFWGFRYWGLCWLLAILRCLLPGGCKGGLGKNVYCTVRCRLVRCSGGSWLL